MLRILLIVIVLATVITVINRLRFSRKNNVDKSAKLVPARMVQCIYCQLHLAQDEALKSDGQYYCCDEHRQDAEKEKCQ